MGSGSSEESSPLEAPVDEVEPLRFEEADPSTSASEIDDRETSGGNDTVVAISVVLLRGWRRKTIANANYTGAPVSTFPPACDLNQALGDHAVIDT